MSAMLDIPIRVIDYGPRPRGPMLGGGLTTILHEILAMLENLSSYGDGGQIDLRSLPMAPGEHGRLRDALGAGEVDITLRLDGVTHCTETSIPGVWWVEHRDGAGATVAEFIEVAYVPGIVRPENEDIKAGMRRLEQGIASRRTHTGGISP